MKRLYATAFTAFFVLLSALSPLAAQTADSKKAESSGA